MKKQLIGKGLFTKCYLNEDKVTVNLVSTDYIKECISLNWFPESRLFPEIKSNDDDTYTMKYFPKVKSLKDNLNSRDWKLYLILRNLTAKYSRNTYDSYCNWREQFETIPDEYEEERTEIIEALDACTNYGSDIGFEISPRNVATDNGNLILLDCFFMISQVSKTRKQLNRRAMY